MNAIQKIRPGPESATVVHGILAYDTLTDRLVTELDIPLFLDTLALKIAQVPADDPGGALSYPLNSRQVETFRFLLGFDVDLTHREYFLEAVPVRVKHSRAGNSKQSLCSPRGQERGTGGHDAFQRAN